MHVHVREQSGNIRARSSVIEMRRVRGIACRQNTEWSELAIIREPEHGSSNAVRFRSDQPRLSASHVARESWAPARTARQQYTTHSATPSAVPDMYARNAGAYSSLRVW